VIYCYCKLGGCCCTLRLLPVYLTLMHAKYIQIALNIYSLLLCYYIFLDDVVPFGKDESHDKHQRTYHEYKLLTKVSPICCSYIRHIQLLITLLLIIIGIFCGLYNIIQQIIARVYLMVNLCPQRVDFNCLSLYICDSFVSVLYDFVQIHCVYDQIGILVYTFLLVFRLVIIGIFFVVFLVFYICFLSLIVYRVHKNVKNVHCLFKFSLRPFELVPLAVFTIVSFEVVDEYLDGFYCTFTFPYLLFPFLVVFMFLVKFFGLVFLGFKGIVQESYFHTDLFEFCLGVVNTIG